MCRHRFHYKLCQCSGAKANSATGENTTSSRPALCWELCCPWAQSPSRSYQAPSQLLQSQPHPPHPSVLTLGLLELASTSVQKSDLAEKDFGRNWIFVIVVGGEDCLFVCFKIYLFYFVFFFSFIHVSITYINSSSKWKNMGMFG